MRYTISAEALIASLHTHAKLLTLMLSFLFFFFSFVILDSGLQEGVSANEEKIQLSTIPELSVPQNVPAAPNQKSVNSTPGDVLHQKSSPRPIRAEHFH